MARHSELSYAEQYKQAQNRAQEWFGGEVVTLIIAAICACIAGVSTGRTESVLWIVTAAGIIMALWCRRQSKNHEREADQLYKTGSTVRANRQKETNPS